MPYQVLITETAEKELAKLPRAVQRRVARKIDALAEDPRQKGVEKLRGSSGFYRARIGDYRLLYQVEDAKLVVLLIRVRHRRDVYRI